MRAENEELMESQSSATSSKHMDSEKRIRREIANSNERRRMQSINQGYQCLKALLPHHNGDKLSKAAILQHTGDYVQTLEKEKTQLLIQNAQLRQKLKEVCPNELQGISPPPKRKKRDTESSDEGIGLGFDDPTSDLLELRKQLDRERQQRMYLEQRMHNLESQMEQDKSRQPTGPVICPIKNNRKEAETIKHEKIDSSRTVQQTKTRIIDSKPAVTVEGDVRCPPNKPNVPVITKSEPVDVPARPGHPGQKQGSEFTSPQSKRNLEMIAEAIRHLEGDNMFSDSPSFSFDVRSRMAAANRLGIVHHHIPHSEESQTESSNSDQEDCKYDSSGCDSPLSSSVPDSVNVGLTQATATLCVTAANPPHIITPLPMAEMHLVGPRLFRPGVIVHNSS